jgi:2-keto-4-pentenoate hydratase/2-oxohepta-3-ene-1,7-dioic acid hydratase in catechol pathway
VSDDGAALSPGPNDVVAPEAGPLDWLDLDGVYWPRLISAWRQGPSGEGVPIGHVPLLAPVPRPGKLLCIGLNYRDHAAETKLVIPERPLLFSTFSTAVIGPGAAIQVPATSSRVDYEAELAVVIGRRTKQVRPEDALGVVAGYTCLNDVSARDFQFSDKQWQRGKSCDTFAPMGPWLVTSDVLGDAAALGIRLRLNGQTLQDSSTAQLIFGVASLVSFLSETITLEPGDVIATGTPGGVGFARTPPIYMKAGDVVEVEIDGIGVLSNPVTG